MTLEASFATACEALFKTDPSEKIGVAVSGGSDSTALLVLACHHFGADRISAVSVDHGLRPEATAELAQVGALCLSLGCSHGILSWTGWNKRGNLQAEARAARYHLMAEWARSVGIRTIALGHTADDQAETVLMRLARGSGVDGLAAMSAVSERDGIRWVRPLLALAREELRDYLVGRGVAWSEDPSNEDPGFDRIRLRQLMPELARIGLDRDRLIQTAAHMARAKSALESAERSLASDAVRQEAGDILIDKAVFDAAPEELQTRLLADALGFVSGHVYRPRFAALQGLLAEGAGTLHGARLIDENDRLRITREWAAVRDHCCASEQLFDGRWRLKGPAQEGDTICALGEAGLAEVDDWRSSGLPRETLLASPAIWRGKDLISAPLAGHNAAWSAELSGKRADFATYLSRA